MEVKFLMHSNNRQIADLNCNLLMHYLNVLNATLSEYIVGVYCRLKGTNLIFSLKWQMYSLSLKVSYQMNWYLTTPVTQPSFSQIKPI